MKVTGPGKYRQDIEGESRAFEELRDMAVAAGADPGKSFFDRVRLVEDLGTVSAEHDIYGNLGDLPIEDNLAWSHLIRYIDSVFLEDLEVAARIWTCQDWEEDFYASVRLDLPTPEDALEQVRDASGMTPEEEAEHAGDQTPFPSEDDLEEFINGDPEPEAPMTPERIAEIYRHADELLAESNDPEISTAARKRLEEGIYPPHPRQNTEPSPAPAVAPAHSVAVDDTPWERLLAPDGTARATPFQRGYVRGKIARHFPKKQAPRLDFMTIGQAHQICVHFDVDPEPLTKGGRGSMGLFVTLVIVFNLLALLLSVVGVGVVLLIWESWFVPWYFITRHRLKPPFSRQPGQ